MKVTYLFGLMVGCLLANSTSAETVLKINAVDDGNGRYAMSMVKLALSKVDTKYKIELDDAELSQARNITDVAEGRFDIMWAATNQEMEDQLQPVRIPLYKGLLGHRIFIINPASQPKFDRIKTVDDLKQISFGQGATWADSAILASNGLTVVKANKYQSLFYMVDGGRFDAFPRGVHEPWGELESHPNLPLAVEKRVMLVYRMPFYLFTSKQNKKLANDLEQGLNRAIADGSFDKTFYGDPMVKAVLEKANLGARLVFNLNNPTLPKETPIDRSELWLDINNLRQPAPVDAPIAETATPN